MSGVPGSAILVNPTPLEKTLADAAWDNLSEIDPAIIRTLVDPATCPLQFLPYLAWALSVDVWDPNWPEATKRAVIAASPEVHRIKGTRKAVKLGLQALGVDASITEWWETTPPQRHGTFHVEVFANGNGPPLDITLINQIRAAIKRSKPKSRVYSLDVALQSNDPVVIGATAIGIHTIKILPATTAVSPPQGPIYLAGFFGQAVRPITVPPRTQ